MATFNKYIARVFFENENGIDFDTIPIVDKSKEEVLRKLRDNSSIYKQFELYNYTFNGEMIKKHGIALFTIDEFFGESDV